MANEPLRSPALSDPSYDQSFSPLTSSQLDAALVAERHFHQVNEAERGQLLVPHTSDHATGFAATTQVSDATYLANFGLPNPRLYLPEQVGGGRGRARSASPQTTPTKLRPRINASEKGQRLILLDRAAAHRAELEPPPPNHPIGPDSTIGSVSSDLTIQSSSSGTMLSVDDPSFTYDAPYDMTSRQVQYDDAYMAAFEGNLDSQGYFHSANPARYQSTDGNFRQHHQPSANFPENSTYLHQENGSYPHPRQERRRSPYPDNASYPHQDNGSHPYPRQERRRSPYPPPNVMEPTAKAQPAQPQSGPGGHKSLFPSGLDLETVLDRVGFQDLVLPPGPASKASTRSDDHSPPLHQTNTATAAPSNGPQINVLPPTPAAPAPAPCSDVFSADQALASADHVFALSSNLDHLEVDFGDSPTIGRLSQEKQDVVQNCFKKVDALFKKAGEATGLTLSQLFNRYQQTLTGTRMVSKWNIYQSYIRQNLEQELSRLPPESRPNTSEKLTMSTTRTAYLEFQKAYPESGDRILMIWKQTHDLTMSQQTVAERTKTFNSCFKDIENLIERAHTRFGFEYLVMGMGSVINQDQGLARLYNTENLDDFFYDRLNVADDALIAHASSHVFDKISRSTIADCEMNPSPTIKTDKTKPSNSSRRPIPSASATKAGSPAPSTTLSKQGDPPVDVVSLRDGLEALAAKADTTFYQEGGKFQYKKMVKILDTQGFQFIGWPQDVPMAGTPKDTTTKGVSGVPAPLRAKLLKALTNVSNPLDVVPVLKPPGKKQDKKTKTAISTKRTATALEESSSSEDNTPLEKKKMASKSSAAKRAVLFEDEDAPAKRKKLPSSPKAKKKGRGVRKKVEDMDDGTEDDLFQPDTDDDTGDAEDPTASPGLSVPPRRTRLQGEPSIGMPEMYERAKARKEAKQGNTAAKASMKDDKIAGTQAQDNVRPSKENIQKKTDLAEDKSSDALPTKRPFGEVAEWPVSMLTKKVADKLFPPDDKSDPSHIVKRQRQEEDSSQPLHRPAPLQQPPSGQSRMQVPLDGRMAHLPSFPNPRLPSDGRMANEGGHSPPPSSDGRMTHPGAYSHPDRYHQGGRQRYHRYSPDAYTNADYYDYHPHDSRDYYGSGHAGHQDGDHRPAYAHHPGEPWVRRRPPPPRGHVRGHVNQFSYGPPPDQASSSSSVPSGRAERPQNSVSSSGALDER